MENKIYVISDIHGRYDRYEKLLKEIDFKDEDRLFIIGDVIDRNEDGIKIIIDIMNRPNVELLLGNHELFLLNSLMGDDLEEMDYHKEIWLDSKNGGSITLKELNRLNENNPDLYKDVLNYISKLEVNKTIELGNKLFYLIHGSTVDKSLYNDDSEFIARSVWNRPHKRARLSPFIKEEINTRKDIKVLIGHTPTIKYNSSLDMSKLFKIYHDYDWIDLDCGCAYDLPYSYLGCLRLNDMKEYYIT